MASNIRIKTVEKLEEHLFTDLAWRKKEMISLKMLVENDKFSETILLRAGVALLCAHFEGFIKKASNCYIGFVSEQKIKYKCLKDNFAALKMEQEFKACSKSGKNSVHTSLLHKYNSLENINFEMKYNEEKSYISTHSNPSSEELKEILKTLGLESDIFETKAVYIDSSLLAKRHMVVHGQKTDLEKEDFVNTFEIILTLLDEYKALIISAADEKKYLK